MTEERTAGSVDGESPRHILVAVDESDKSRKAVLYVADFLAGTQRFKITLFHVVIHPREEGLPENREPGEYRKARVAEAREMLERYRRMLVDGGFDEDDVAVELLESDSEPVADVILKAHESLGTCTVVVGRRAKSRQEEFLFGSVSSRIIKHAKKCSVWVVE